MSAQRRRSRAGRPVHAAPRRARRARSGHPRPVLHARGAGTGAAAADERLPRGRGRAGVPDRPDRPRHACALRARAAASELHVLGPLGNGFDLDVERPLLVGGGIGIAPLPYLSQALGWRRPRSSASAASWHAEAAALVPNAEVCIEPTYVTALLPEERHDVLACGPEPMLAALRALVPGRAARLGGADGVRLRRLLRLRRRDRRRAEASLRRRARCCLCCLTPPAASTR